MTIIYTNENNPATLKLLVASNYANKKATIKIVNLLDRTIEEPRHLPYIEIDDTNIFIPNAALWYLFPSPDDISNDVNEWLEWESYYIAPNAAHILGSSLKNEKLKQVLVNGFKKLNGVLENKTFIVGGNVSACDIALWSILYPLSKDENNKKEYLEENLNIIKWINYLENLPQFKNALEEFKIVPGHSSYHALLNGAKYLLPSSTHDSPSLTTQTSQIDTVSNDELHAAEKAWQKDITKATPLKPVEKLVLPHAGEKNILITSALPYVNNVPHLGNIIGCVLSADVFARFCRLCNYNTLYICGTDEYGTATETKALEEGLSCKEICDKYFKIHDEIYKWFNISFTHFGRTSTPQQTELCQAMFLKLNDNGFMFTQAVDQLHCENCDRYLADRFVEGGCPNIGCTYEDARGDQCDGCGKLVNAVELKNPRCKVCSNTPKLKTSSQFFLDLPKLEPLLLHWMKKISPGWSHNAEVISKAWLKEGLKPRCITRDLKWGVPVPLDGYRNKVFYVWFDAPIGYLSITKNYTVEWEKWWRPQKGTDVALYQFMAKDNVPFHGVMFPATLLGANNRYTIVSHVMATEYLNYEDGKFSKSRGVGVFGTDAQNTGIPSDVWRFYLLYVRPESQDSSFSWVDLATKNNSELLNNLGNFVNRALVFAKNFFNYIIPNMELTKDDYTLLALCTRELKSYVASLEKAKLRDGIRHILSISRHGNQYMQSNQPWVLLKGSDADKVHAGTVIGVCCNIACLLATLLHPYMPETSDNLKKQLNAPNTSITAAHAEVLCVLPPGHKIGEPSPLFTKIEPAKVEELKKKYAGKQSENGTKSVNKDIKSLETEVAKQADKVRLLKSTGVEKKVWQPEVEVLLKLKKQLEEALKTEKSKTQTPETGVQNGIQQGSPEDIKKLQDEIDKQALVVRQLKEGGKEKAIWQPEVSKLLALKSQFAAISGQPVPTAQKNKKGKK